MEYRRSSRLAHKPNRSTQSAGVKLAEVATPPKPVNKNPVAKKRRTTHAEDNTIQRGELKSRKRRSRLQNVGELPLEMLLEVFKHLGANDLLNLSRTTKALRAIVLDFTLTREAWNSAIENIKPELPLEAFPEGWSPAQIARMVYDRECQICGRAAGVTTYWTERVKLCDKCIPMRFTKCTYTDPMCLHFVRCCNRIHRKDGTYFPTTCVEEVAKSIEKLKDSEDAVAKYTQEREQIVHAIQKFEWEMFSWELDRSYYKKQDIVKRQTERQTAYKAKLASLGFSQEVSQMSTNALGTLPAIKGTKPLTDKEWARLEPQVVECMAEVRQLFAARAKALTWSRRISCLEDLRTYYRSRHWGEIIPLVDDLANMEPFRSLVFETPIDEAVSLDSLMTSVDSIATLAQTWRESSVNLLVELLPDSPPKGRSKQGKIKNFDPSVLLDRATTLFSCIWCPEVLAFPSILQHPCLTKKHRGRNQGKLKKQDDDSLLGLPYTLGAPWNEGCDQVAFDLEAAASAKVIVATCGMDPDTATFQEMDNLDTRIECLRCHGANKKCPRLVMTWRNAVLHELEKHANHTEESQERGAKWALIAEQDVSAAKAKEATQKKGPPSSKRVLCNECGFIQIGSGGVLLHPYHMTDRLKDDGTCAHGHDMSHGTREVEIDSQKRVYLPNRAGFKRHPYPVKI